MKRGKVTENWLHPDNCNKAQCQTCIFGSNPVLLSPERMVEIVEYLAAVESSHICHTSGKTCFGALELQSKIYHAMGMIPEPTPECLLKAAREYLGFPHKEASIEESTRKGKKR